MTWRRLNLAYQWGGHPGRPGRPTPVWHTVHLPPRGGLVVVTKAAVLLRRWFRPPAGVGRQRRARWVTLGVRSTRPGRWATRATYLGGQLSCTTRAVRAVAPTGGYDFTRWRYPVRGVTTWDDPVGGAYHAETYLVRPRYV